MGYNKLFGNERIQEKFDLYFHWFNIVHEIGHIIVDIAQINIDTSVVKAYSEDINSENANKVLNQCIKNLDIIGVKITDVNIELVDNPEIQCCLPV
ncbi:hypothetical protein [Clostridium hydrogenum]|uniref:hypothetical protein n=1 Tax=Clostridium hydrogenum TaxID=2855764 RepID=UPI001F1D6B45|nr:hypothetical protein [Clostridium hydrogenum]